MKNIKGYAVANDGNMIRIAITYDEIDDAGKVVNGNQKMNRVVTDSACIKHLEAVNEYAQKIVDDGE